MSTKSQRWRSCAALLLALALGACGPQAPGAQAPTSAATGIPAPTVVAATAAPAPTAEPTAVPTVEPTVEPTTAPPAAEPTVDPAISDTLPPADALWVHSGGMLYGDDESIDFQQRGLPAPAYQMRAAPDGSYLAYISQDNRLAVIDMRRGSNIIRDDEPLATITAFAGIAFSPDSRSLALTAIEGDSWRLQVRDLQGGATRTILEGSTIATASDTQPLLPGLVAWAAGGLVVQRLLWASDAPPRDVELVSPADGSLRSLRKGEHISVYPSVDGSRLAVVSGRLPIGDLPTAAITVIDTVSGQQTEIAPSQQMLVRAVRWSPDGSRLLYAVAKGYQSPATSIHALSADGSNEQVVEVGAPGIKATYSDIAWKDDATALLLSAQSDGYVHLYALPLSSFDITGLSPLAAFERRAAQGQADEIVYAPRASGA